jgi:hypothetical protein
MLFAELSGPADRMVDVSPALKLSDGGRVPDFSLE